MPSISYLSVKAGGNLIRGSVAGGDHDGKIHVHQVEQNVARAVATTHAAIGGAPRHSLVVTKPMDRATPLLLEAMSARTDLDVLVEHFLPVGQGAGPLFYTVRLTDARISKIRHLSVYTPEGDPDPSGPHVEDVHFVYRKVSWRAEISGIEAEHADLATGHA